ncbi:MAG: hypothetical protein ACI88H_003284 [Cocleimonas sp.]|jgi:hypothetical protein
MSEDKQEFLNQALSYPLESLDKIDEFATTAKKYISWNKVGVLSDEGNKNTIILLLTDDIQATLRLNINYSDYAKALKLLSVDTGSIQYRNWQGNNIETEMLLSFESINDIWTRSSNQSSELEESEIENLFLRFENERLEKGRGQSFGVETRRKVMCDSHGCCMFSGCGEKLNIDLLTGTEGNYSYLAHNVASSEQGERGIPLLSEKLSNDPNNVLLLCDKHHRLIDKVASSDYNAETLSKMRVEFGIIAESLLTGLSYQPIPVYSVLWPVNQSVISTPENREISSCLSLIHARMHGARNDIYDNDHFLRTNPAMFNLAMPGIVKEAADSIIQQTKKHGHKAALFAFGPMPALVALGACLGNKSQFTPMLKYRDGNCWMWPNVSPVKDFYTIDDLKSIESGDEFIISIALTAEPGNMVKAANEIIKNNNAQIINIKANTTFLGNAAIPNPHDGMAFSSKLQSLFHSLKSDYHAKKIHLLVCASNAASVFIGQAYDLHHPEMLVYDFVKDGMEPRILISNDSTKTSLSIP